MDRGDEWARAGRVGGEWASDWHDPEAALLPDEYLPDVPELVRAIVWRRGYRSAEAARAFLDPLAFRLPDAPLAPSLPIAVDRVLQARASGERVAIWGDYDVDGQTATALLVGAFRSVGVDVSFHVPACDDARRGLTPDGLRMLAARGARLLVTCDCGTNDVEMVALARALGMDVIVTDHHARTGPAPDALAVVHAGQAERHDPVYGLAGVGVAYLLARGVLRGCGQARAANSWLDLVALGTVADVTATSPVNRALLARGLPLLWEQPRAGIRALLEVVRKRPRGLDTATISFGLGPLLNAAGRLGSPRDCVDLLLMEDVDEARAAAARLRTLQEARNRLVEAIEAEVAAQVGRGDVSGPLIAVGHGWPAAVLGRVAGSVARRHNRAAVIISVPSNGGPARGSARASGDLDLCAILAGCEQQLIAYGGHAHAAGFTVEASQAPAVAEALRGALATRAGPPGLCVDAALEWAALPQPGPASVEFAGVVQRLAPFCAGNPDPVFASYGLWPRALRRFGSDGRHAALALLDAEGRCREVKWWGAPREWQWDGPVDVAYTVARDDWRQIPSIELTLRGIRPHQPGAKDTL